MGGLLIEIVLWLFAFILIRNLNTYLHRRVKLLLIFAARLVYVLPLGLQLHDANTGLASSP